MRKKVAIYKSRLTQTPPGDWWRGFILARSGVALYDSRQYPRQGFA